MRSRALSTLLACLFAATVGAGATSALAGTLTIDDATDGTVYDSIGDGWFFAAPQQPPPDGTGDAGAQALGVGLKNGVLELRALAEFPLASLHALDADDIVTATLTITIDDVLSTFGPGADFDGTAAASLTAFGYEGDGTIALVDFGNVAGQPLGTIDTTLRGVITDASLLSGGPEVFTVDVTTRLKTILAGSATHFGVVLATTDDQSGTSLDALSPPGVAGATLPFLTITTVAGPPTEVPVLSKAALKCQKALGKQAQGFQSAIGKQVGKCFDGILTAVSKGKPAATLQAKCAAAIDPATATSKLAAGRTKALANILKACAGVTPADIGAPCNPTAADLNAVASCTLDEHRGNAEDALRSAYAAPCVLLTSVGLDGGFPRLCDPL